MWIWIKGQGGPGSDADGGSHVAIDHGEWRPRGIHHINDEYAIRVVDVARRRYHGQRMTWAW